ncbi:MAG: SAM hydroxide adenosyltransferase, partial [bacterium]
KKIEDFGQRIHKIKKLKLKKDSIIYIDEFGNIITSIRKISPLVKKVTIHYKDREVKARFAQAFAEVKEGEFVVLRGSSGYLEIDKNRGSAARSLGARVGETIKLYPS